MKTIIGFFSVLAIVCLCSSVFSAEQAWDPQRDVLALASSDKTVRDKTSSDLREVRQEIIRGLLRIAGQESAAGDQGFFGSRELSINLIGAYHAKEAVPFLVDNVNLEVPTEGSTLSPYEGFPCVVALIHIGLPSIAGIIDRLDKPVTEQELSLFATVSRGVEGPDFAVMRLDLAMKKTSGQKLDNLRKLRDLVKTRKW